MTNSAKSVFCLLLAAAPVSACSTVSPPAAPSVIAETRETPKGGIRHEAVTMRARVEAVDQKKRSLDLLGFDGTRETIVVGPEVKNLPQVRKGDEVVVTYYAAVAFDVLAKGEKRAPVTAGEGLEHAANGQMPGAAALKTETIVVDVVRLDPERGTATLKGPQGSVQTVDIQNPAVFRKVKVGDRVEIRLTEALAVDVQRVAEK